MDFDIENAEFSTRQGSGKNSSYWIKKVSKLLGLEYGNKAQNRYFANARTKRYKKKNTYFRVIKY